MLRTYRGGCHCPSVMVEAQIDFSQGTVRCNFTFCSQVRLWLVNVRPEAFCFPMKSKDPEAGLTQLLLDCPC
jgi:hypothetical protein